MAPTIRLWRKTAVALLELVEEHAGLWSVEELRDALGSKAKPKKALPFKGRRAVKTAKKRTKKEETAEIRVAVFERANGRCEACLHWPPTDLDHFHGRTRVRQSVENCWALCRQCHKHKTLNTFGARHNLQVFEGHCIRHGYMDEVARLVGLIAKHETKAEFAKGAAAHG